MQTQRQLEAPIHTPESVRGLHGGSAGRWVWTAATALAFIGPFLLYWRSMAPTIYNLDSAELTTAAATGGLVHATGYPLYLLIARFWNMLPISDLGYRMNLLSVFCGALTIALLIQILRRIGVGPWAALCAAGFLVATRFFWAMALVAEVYTLHTAMMCIIVLLLLHWADRPSAIRLGLAGGVVGLAAGNHASIVLLVPGFLVFVLTTAPLQISTFRSLGAAAAGLLCGFSVYLYLPWLYAQHPIFNYLVFIDSHGKVIPVDLGSVKGLVWLLSASPFTELFFARGGTPLIEELGNLVLELWRSSFIVAFGPALLGVWITFRQSRALGCMLGLSLLMNAAFFLSYGALDKETMYLPMYVVWAIWIGVGSQYILSRAYELAGWVSATCLALVLAGTVAFSIAWCFPLVNLADDWSSRELGEGILEDLEPGALYVGSWHTVPVIHFLQIVEGRRPDVQVINRFHISEDDLAILIDREVGRRPVYSDQRHREKGNRFRSRPQSSFYRIERIEVD